MYKILIVYSNFEYPLRVTIRDHLYSFREFGNVHCFYLNVYFHDLPAYIHRVDFDLIIFHTIFLANRWTKPVFLQQVERLEKLKVSSAVKIVLPQDEFIHTDVLSAFINEFEIDHVFSVAPPSEWPKIYQDVDPLRVRFHSVLTGYLSDKTIRKIQKIAKSKKNERDIDIGYRAWHAEPWLGRHGLLKVKIAEQFQRASQHNGLNTDISTRSEDTLVGNLWFEFLLRCKYTIGVEGGASLLDRDGSIRSKTNNYLAECRTKGYEPTFEEIEEACFSGLDGLLSLFALSPRHLEACVTKTCQILIEGEYNGILQPERHFILLKPDFSNLSEVLTIVSQDVLRENIVETAYREIVESGKCTYSHFVEKILSTSLKKTELKPLIFSDKMYWFYNNLIDNMTWLWAVFRLWVFKNLTGRQIHFLRRLKQKVFG